MDMKYIHSSSQICFLTQKTSYGADMRRNLMILQRPYWYGTVECNVFTSPYRTSSAHLEPGQRHYHKKVSCRIHNIKLQLSCIVQWKIGRAGKCIFTKQISLLFFPVSCEKSALASFQTNTNCFYKITYCRLVTKFWPHA